MAQLTPSATSDTAKPRLGRTIVAIIVGFIFVFVLSIATDVILHVTGIFPPMGQRMSDSQFVVATVYRTVYTVMGGYITALLAPRNPVKHAVILGVVGFVFAVIGVLATWNAGPEFGPHWYPILLVVLAVPSCWLGGILYRPKV